MNFNPLDYSLCFEKPRRLTDVTSWHEHVPFAFTIVQILKPKIFIELGTHKGDSYCAFCQAVDTLGLDTACYAIDTWKGDEHSGLYGSDILEELRKYHDPIYGHFSHLIQCTFDQAIDHFSDGSVDLLHIDGLHTYEAVKHDFNSWLPKMSSCGVILLHDTNVREREFGVWKLWEELKYKYYNFEFKHGNGLGILIIGTDIPKDILTLLDLDKQGVTIAKFFSELGDKIISGRRLENSIQSKDVKIRELENNVQSKDVKIGELENSMQSKDVKIGELENNIKSKDVKIGELENNIKSKDVKIGELENNIKSKDNSVRNLEFVIQSVNQSIIWQSVGKYQKVIDKLLPHGTKRRSHYDLILIGSRFIFNEGWRNFLVKFNKRITNISNRKPPNNGHIFDSYCMDNVKMTKGRIEKFKYMPKISVIIPVYNTGHIWLTKALDSVIFQLYENWELCIVDDASTDNNIKKILENYVKKDVRIVVKYLDKNKGISGSSNDAISLTTGEFVVLMDHDDELTNDALYEIVKTLNDRPDTDVIYSDSDKIDDKGNRFDFEFKPDWSPELLLSYCYFSHVKVLRKALIEKIGGFRKGFEGSQDYDLVLRAVEETDRIRHIPKILYHWRSIPGSVAYSTDEKPLSIEKGRKAVEDALARRKIHGDAIVPKFAEKNKLGIYKINFWLKEKPKISIIIPTKDKLNLLKRCIDSIENKTTYKNYEIIIADTGSVEKDTLKYLDETKHKVLHIVQDKFNFSKINNYAVSSVNTEFVLLLNNDTEVITENWLEEMLGYMMSDPKIGAVGAKLIYKDGRVQHAGVVLGLNNGLAGHANKLIHCDDGGYLNYGLVSRNYSAVTAACLLTRKKYYEEVLGLDEDNFSVAYNDVDFCLKLTQKGYRIVLNPYALLYHHEGSSRGTGKCNDNPTEENSLRKKWGYLINKGDRYYNPHLSLRDENFRIENIEDSIVGNKNLLFISHNLNFEGAPYVQYNLAKELKNRGYSITVMSPLDGPLKDYYLDMGIRVNILRVSLDNENNKKAFMSWTRSERFELAHINTIVNCQLVCIISGVIPVIWAIHESERGHYFSTIDKLKEKSFKDADQVVFVSNATRRVYSDLEYNGNFCTIYNGINITDIESFKQKNNKSDLRKKHGFSDNCKIVTIIGTTCERKGQKIFVEAAIKLLKDIRNVDIHFLITSATEGNYLRQLESMIKNNNASTNIHIVSKTKDIFDYYLISDIFVCTSFIESLPTVILEAMTFELPIIATNVYGIPEEIEDGKSGILIAPGDSELLAKKMELLIKDENISSGYVKNAYARVRNDFSLDTMVDRYQRLIEILIGGSTRCIIYNEIDKKSDMPSLKLESTIYTKKEILSNLLLSKFDQWNIDSVEINNEKVEICGWTIFPINHDYVFACKYANIIYIFDGTISPSNRSDINETFWYVDKNRYNISTFVCKLGRNDAMFDQKGDFEFLIIDRKTNLPICSMHEYYFPIYHIREKHQIRENIKRTTGADDFSNYILQGYTIYKNIMSIITEYKLNLNNLKILDFGCGSGRVLSHFSNNDTNIEGADIDNDNLQLCKREFGSAKFHLFPLYPPTKLEAESFDVMYGISVFTHLDEDTQNKWLEELNRIAKKGAYILLSVHSDVAVSRSRGDFPLDEYIHNGFIFSSQDCSDINIYINKNDYYGTTYHSHKYIYMNWAKFFEIVDIRPGYICNFQDLVIMRKRQ